MFKKEITSQIVIDASAERVWHLLTDFESFPQWNPFIRRAQGKPEAGARIEVHIQPSGGRGMTFRPKILKAEPNRELRWLGRLWMPCLFDGEHVFTIEPIGKRRVRFVQREIFTGLLVPFLKRELDNTKRGFEEMNRSLKLKAEQSAEYRSVSCVLLECENSFGIGGRGKLRRPRRQNPSEIPAVFSAPSTRHTFRLQYRRPASNAGGSR